MRETLDQLLLLVAMFIFSAINTVSTTSDSIEVYIVAVLFWILFLAWFNSRFVHISLIKKVDENETK